MAGGPSEQCFHDADLAHEVFCHSVPGSYQCGRSSNAKCLPVVRAYSGEGLNCHNMLRPVCFAVLVVSTAPSVSPQHLDVCPTSPSTKQGSSERKAQTYTCLFCLSFRNLTFALSLRLHMWKPLRSVTMTGVQAISTGAAGQPEMGPGSHKGLLRLVCYEAVFKTWDFLELSVLLTSRYELPGPLLQRRHLRRTGRRQRGLFLPTPPQFLPLGRMFVFLACDTPAGPGG